MKTAGDVIRILNLAPLPVEGGYFKETYRSANSTAIYYLLTPETKSLLHRLSGDEIYHFYAGDPVELLMLEESGASEVIDFGVPPRFQQLVPAGVWQGSQLKRGGRWALMGTTMAPPFSLHGFELGKRGELLERYPDLKDRIEALTPPS